ncbi:MAG: hypothetical protein H0X36_03085 [Sphingomonadaceae bacterium]|nr:hypothetical protein [Sphingomonadaceae bacterium]
MRRLALILPLTANLLSSCGPKTLALPVDPVDRAASCGVVAAADARKSGNSSDVGKPLPLAQSAHVLHYAMLAASAGKKFEAGVAANVVQRMPTLEAGITCGQWQPLKAQCDAAYPQAAMASPAPLPADPLGAQLGCSALSEFIGKAMASQDAAYGDQLTQYRLLGARLDPGIGAKLSARGIKGFEATQAARNKALGQVVKLGSPAAVLDACIAKYPAPAKTAV